MMPNRPARQTRSLLSVPLHSRGVDPNPRKSFCLRELTRIVALRWLWVQNYRQAIQDLPFAVFTLAYLSGPISSHALGSKKTFITEFSLKPRSPQVFAPALA